MEVWIVMLPHQKQNDTARNIIAALSNRIRLCDSQLKSKHGVVRGIRLCKTIPIFFREISNRYYEKINFKGGFYYEKGKRNNRRDSEIEKRESQSTIKYGTGKSI
jgi:hypothetical protein